MNSYVNGVRTEPYHTSCVISLLPSSRPLRRIYRNTGDRALDRRRSPYPDQAGQAVECRRLQDTSQLTQNRQNIGKGHILEHVHADDVLEMIRLHRQAGANITGEVDPFRVQSIGMQPSWNHARTASQFNRVTLVPSPVAGISCPSQKHDAISESASQPPENRSGGMSADVTIISTTCSKRWEVVANRRRQNSAVSPSHTASREARPRSIPSPRRGPSPRVRSASHNSAKAAPAE
jgi:hypothetical protein